MIFYISKKFWQHNMRLLRLLGLLALLAETGTAFRLPALPAHRHRHRHRHVRWELNMMAAGPDGGGNMKARLREESEAPFQTVRLFLYPAVGGLALTSSAFSVAQIVGGNVCSVDQTPVPVSARARPAARPSLPHPRTTLTTAAATA